jgi:hypothetical protein
VCLQAAVAATVYVCKKGLASLTLEFRHFSALLGVRAGNVKPTASCLTTAVELIMGDSEKGGQR